MNDMKKKYIKNNIVIILISFIICSFLTISYAALITMMDVTGTVGLKSPDNIRLIDIYSSSSVNGGAEVYNPNFYIETFTNTLNLPNLDSEITYTVALKNESPKNYMITDIIADSFTNSDMEYVISGLSIGDVINTNTLNQTFTITFKYKDTVTILPTNNDLSSLIRIVWNETYMLTINSEGGSVCDPSSKRVTNTLIYGTLCTPSRTDYVFSGFYTGQKGTGSLVTSDTIVNLSNDQTIYANWIYEEELLVGNIPKLTNGMIPVTYDEVNRVWIKADLHEAWYDYSTGIGKWANMVTVTSANRNTYLNANSGTTIPFTDINTMFVWIPRYSYAKKETWGEGGTSSTSPGYMTVKFADTSTHETGDASYTTTVSAADYRTHPAFYFDTNNNGINDTSEAKTGFWFAKFETSPLTACTAGTTVNAACDVTTIQPIIKPNTIALRGVRSSTVYTSVNNYMNGANGNTIYGLPNNINSYSAYVTKNSEWGAVAYLTQSLYGKYGNASFATSQLKEVYINNSTSYYTGRSGGRPGYATGYTATNGCFEYDGKIRVNNVACNPTGNFSGTVNQYLTGTNLSLAYGASTTGTPYGIYDMSGGANEIMMTDYYNAATSPYNYAGRNSTQNTGFNGTYGTGGALTTGRTWPQLRYYDRYTTTVLTTTCGGSICYGHALSEVYSAAGFYADTNGSALTTSYVIFLRGGTRSSALSSGIFFAGRSYGNQATTDTFRISLMVLE